MASVTQIGSTIDRKYEVIALIGEGGMSKVWLARDERLRKLWAIKEIRPNEHGVRGELIRQALIDEADFLKRLDHPAIPRVVDVLDTGRTTYVVMDYVDGVSLAQMLRENERPFAQEQVVRWGIELCDVLSYLHNRTPPVVYRDMKPANVILREDGSVRLVDFGIATEVGEKSTSISKRMGTPGYAAPEQLSGETQALGATCAMDIYSLGATLYSLVTGHVPKRVNDGEGVRTLFDMRPIREWNPQLSEGLERVLLRATQEDPSRRYASIDEMRYDLEHYEQLTDAWRTSQRRKVTVFRRWLGTAAALAIAGVATLALGMMFRQASYEELMRAASVAPRVGDQEGQSSPAEKLYRQAIEVGQGKVEPYLSLLSLYEDDYRFSDDEDRRMRETLAKSKPLESDPQYAELCYALGVCYLSYFKIDAGGGSVGNAALASVEAARPWFSRALVAYERDGQEGLAEPDAKAAATYETIAGFYGRLERAGIEGRPASAEFTELWDALDSAMEREATAPVAERSVEGIRARLCQVAAEVVASPAYLTGFARSGVSEDEAHRLLEHTVACMDSLEEFFGADEHQRVYGPLAQETRSCLEIAQRNIDDVYHSPIAVMDEQQEVSEP